MRRSLRLRAKEFPIHDRKVEARSILGTSIRAWRESLLSLPVEQRDLFGHTATPIASAVGVAVSYRGVPMITGETPRRFAYLV